MAHEIVGIGTSHSPQMSTPPEQWALHAERDIGTEELHFHENVYDYESLVAQRAHEGLSRQITPKVWKERHEACQRATAELSTFLQGSDIDVVVVIGNDHREFFDINLPALAVYRAETVDSIPTDPEEVWPSIRPSLWARQAEETESYPCMPDLADHVIGAMTDDGFDVTEISHQSPGRSIGHAFTHIRRRLMSDRAIPLLPVLVNSYYPPNQPTARRCYEIGRALRRALESFPGTEKFCVIASGGLSHFVVDEEFDRAFLAALEEGDADALTGIRSSQLTQGTAETRHWIAAAGALHDRMFDLIEYVPGYRTEAGTGCGMAFSIWR